MVLSTNKFNLRNMALKYMKKILFDSIWKLIKTALSKKPGRNRKIFFYFNPEKYFINLDKILLHDIWPFISIRFNLYFNAFKIRVAMCQL